MDELKVMLITPELVQSLIPPRNILSRKGDNGIVLVVGGSGLYHGAPILSSLAALRSGVDLVYAAIPKSNVLVCEIIFSRYYSTTITKGQSNRRICKKIAENTS